MSWILTASVGASTAVGAYSSYSSSKATNRQMQQAQESAERRYMQQADVAEQQFTEQQQNAMEQMTEISRKFLQAKGQAKALQAETGTTGVTAKRIEAVTRTAYSDAKGKLAREIDTNIINIANNMLANRIDTEAVIAEAESKKQNVFTNTLLGGIQGAVTGVQLGSAIKSFQGSGVKTTTTT